MSPGIRKSTVLSFQKFAKINCGKYAVFGGGRNRKINSAKISSRQVIKCSTFNSFLGKNIALFRSVKISIPCVHAKIRRSVRRGSVRRGNVRSGKCLFGEVSVGEMSVRGSVRAGKCPSGKRPSGKRPSGKCPSGMCPSGKCPSGKRPSGKCPGTGVAAKKYSREKITPPVLIS